MYFTREDILKILKALLLLGIKDSEFKAAHLPLLEDDTITIVQNNVNRKVKVSNIIGQFNILNRQDFINVSDMYDEHYITISEAIKLLPERKRKEGLVITFQNANGNWQIYLFEGTIDLFVNDSYWKDLFDFKYPIIDSVLPDEEDLTLTYPDNSNNSFIKLKDKEYNLDNFSGLGKVILRKNIVEVEDPTYGKIKKNILYQDMINKSNTIYVIQYDYTLGEDITIPANCILEFEGGSISGAYTITGTNTCINASLVKILGIDVILTGSWNVAEAYPEWFGAKGDGVTDDTVSIRKAVDLSLLARSCIVFSKGTYIVGTFDISDNEGGYSAIQIKSNLRCIGKGGIIKVKDGVNRQGFAFRGIFSSVLNTWVENITFIGMHFDLNGTNNLYPSGTDSLMSCCAVKMFYPNGKILIKDCYFENGPGAHFLAPGYVKDCIISSCTFKNCADSIQGNTNCYDHSSILVAGKNIEITDNKFINNNQSYNATAIEVETNNAVTKGNIIDGYGVGYLIASVGVSKTDVTTFIGNIIYNTRKPIELWNEVETSGNIVISNNIINQSSGGYDGTIINLYDHVVATVKNIIIDNNLIYDSRKTPPSSSFNILICNGYIQWLTFKNNIIKDITGGILLNNGCKHIFVENNIFDNVIRNTNTSLKGFLIVQSESAISEDINLVNNRISAASVEGVNPADTIGIWVLSKHKSITIKDNEITGFGTPIHTEYADFSEGNSRTINISNAFIKYSDAAPTTGTWTRGNIVFNTAPSANGVFAWSCISSGTPGTWKEVKIEA